MSLEYKVRIAQIITNGLKLNFNDSIDNIASSIKVHVKLSKNKVSYLYPLESYFDPSNYSIKNEYIQEIGAIEYKYQKYVQFIINEKKFIPDILKANINSTTLFQYRNPSKYVVEFSSPNIGKPFYFTHLRSTIIGSFVSNIHKYLNNEVVNLNFIGNWGTRAALIYNSIEDLNIKDNELFEAPIKTLHEAYENVNQIMESKNAEEFLQRAEKKIYEMEMSDSPATKKWQSLREYLMKDFSYLYSKLNIRFDEYCWESDYSYHRIQPLIDQLKNQEILFRNKDNVYVVEVESVNEQMAFLKHNDTTLYLARDLSAALDRFERYNFDKMLYVVDNAQLKHFKTLRDLLGMINSPCDKKIQHLRFGFIVGPCTNRKWQLYEIIDEIQRRMDQKQMKAPRTGEIVDNETAFILGASALIINDLKRVRTSNYEFDWGAAFRATGYTGIYMQYTHCKLYILEDNSGIELPSECDPDALHEPEAVDLIREVARFEDVLIRTYNNLEGYILVQYLFTLCDLVSKTLNKLKIETNNKHIASQRLLMYNKVRLVLCAGMKILGLKPLNRM